ncbi:MAG: XapX domain-containing protein [Halodesulfurarchaeum sp.]
MNLAIPIFALLTGVLTGTIFAALEAPIPAPPNMAGVLGIAGIYLGYVLVEGSDFTVDLLSILGLR